MLKFKFFYPFLVTCRAQANKGGEVVGNRHHIAYACRKNEQLQRTQSATESAAEATASEPLARAGRAGRARPSRRCAGRRLPGNQAGSSRGNQGAWAMSKIQFKSGVLQGY